MTAQRPHAEIKGRAVLDGVEMIRARIGGPAFEAILTHLEPATADLLGSSVVSQWFPLDAYVELLRMVIDVIDGGDESVFAHRAEVLFEKQLRGVYSAFIRPGSPGSLVARIAAVHATYFRGVDLAVTSHAGGAATLRYTGFARQHRLMEHAILAFYRKALELSGASDVTAAFTTGISAGLGHADLALTWR